MDYESLALEPLLVYRRDDPTCRADRATARGLVRLDRGVYLDWNRAYEQLPVTPTPWEIERLIARGRLHAVMRRLRSSRSTSSPIMFTGESALVARGIRIWNENPDVTYRRQSGGAHGHPNLPAVVTPVHNVRSVRLRRVESVTNDAEITAIQARSGLTCAPPGRTIADMVAKAHPLTSFVNSCLFLRYLADFSLFDLRQSRDKEAEVRSGLFDEVQINRYLPRERLLRSVLRKIDSGVDSAGEAVMLWMAHCWLPETYLVVTQYPIRTQGRSYFVDAAIPQLRYVLEFDGGSKLGQTEFSWAAQSRKFLERQRNLQEAGWTVIRMHATDLTDITKALWRLGEALRPSGVIRTEPGGPLWRPFP